MADPEKPSGRSRPWVKTAVAVVGATLATFLVLAGLLWWFLSNTVSSIVRNVTTIPQPSCEIAVSHDLGRSPSGHDPPPLFSTNGSPIFVTGTEITDSGGFFEFHSGSVYIGEDAVHPTYNGQTGVVTGARFEGIGYLDGYTEFALPAGRYWLWTSRGLRVSVSSCDPAGVFDVVPGS